MSVEGEHSLSTTTCQAAEKPRLMKYLLGTYFLPKRAGARHQRPATTTTDKKDAVTGCPDSTRRRIGQGGHPSGNYSVVLQCRFGVPYSAPPSGDLGPRVLLSWRRGGRARRAEDLK